MKLDTTTFAAPKAPLFTSLPTINNNINNKKDSEKKKKNPVIRYVHNNVSYCCLSMRDLIHVRCEAFKI